MYFLHWKNLELWLKFLWRSFLLTISQHPSDNKSTGLLPVGRQAITWNDVNQDWWCHMVSLGHTELKLIVAYNGDNDLDLGSALTPVLACCLTAPSHYLNQCWLIISEVLWHSPEANFTGNCLKFWEDTEHKISRVHWHWMTELTTKLYTYLSTIKISLKN